MRAIQRELVRLAKSVNATVAQSKNGHYIVVGNGWRVTTSATPSCPFWLVNVRNDVRRALLKGGATC